MIIKKEIFLIIFILITPLISALEECSKEMETLDLPCKVVTTYEYPDSCETYSVTIYDTNNATLETKTLGKFGKFCTFNFTYTEIGSYYYEITSGDTGGILIKNKMQQIYSLLVYGGYLIIVLILIAFMHKFKEDEGTPMVYGIIASALSLIMAGILVSGFKIIYGVTLFFDVNYYFIALTMGIGLYTGAVAIAFYRDIKPKEEY